MIFATIGTHNIGFERLVVKMDEIAGWIDEEVVIQIGSTRYTPKHAGYFDFTDEGGIFEHLKRARVVVTHAGAGSVLDALSLAKPIILFPRLKKYGECFDDQQLELTRVLSENGRAIAVYDAEDLESAIRSVGDAAPAGQDKSRDLVTFLKGQFAET